MQKIWSLRRLVSLDWVFLSGLFLGGSGCLLWGNALQAANEAENAATAARHWRQAHEGEIVAEFAALLGQPNYAGDAAAMAASAQQIRALLSAHQISSELLESPGAVPAIYAEIPSPGATRWLCLYAHYDGQPVQSERWHDPPYSPVLRAGKVEQAAPVVDWQQHQGAFDPEWRLYARSAGDDKAPIIALISALEALRAAAIPLGVNLKIFLEGEEEIGSPNLAALVAAHRERLAADFWLFLDGPLHQSSAPTLAFGVRGVSGVDVTVFGPQRGLHSGHYGNYAANPIARLAHLLSSMRDEQGRILIADFVPPSELSAGEQALLAQNPQQDASLLQDLGLAEAELPGERYELSLLRPALNFKGIRSGEVGAQARNVIEPSATASIGFRLVPGQSLEQVRHQFEQHLRQQGYQLILGTEPSAEERARYRRLARLDWEAAGYPAVRTPLDHPAAQALIELVQDYRARSDLSAILPQAPAQVVISPSLGGSLPLAHITENLQVPFALLPIANHDDNQHAPNEHLRLGNLWYGIEIYATLLAAWQW